MSNEQGEWQEYRLLILKELQTLNESANKHSAILTDMDKTLLKQAEQLNDHMARTDAAEARIEMLHKDIEPLKKADWLAKFFLKVGAGIGAIIGSILGVIEILKYFADKR